MKRRFSISSKLKYFILLIVWCVILSNASAQTWSLKVCDHTLNDTLVYRFSSKQEALREANDIYYRTLDDGYFLTRADTIISDSTVFLLLKTGERFMLHEVHLFRDSIEKGQVRSKEVLAGSALNRVFTKSLAEYENEGYPFASIRLDSLIQIPSKKSWPGYRE